ncbi:hypothetical protein ABH899_000476 [Paenibacillus sp. RC84]
MSAGIWVQIATILRDYNVYNEQLNPPMSETRYSFIRGRAFYKIVLYLIDSKVVKPKDVKEILEIGEKQTYEFLNQSPPPFHMVRMGRKIKISECVFRRWFEG